jgi:hypothetical protein
MEQGETMYLCKVRIHTRYEDMFYNNVLFACDNSDSAHYISCMYMLLGLKTIKYLQ